MFDDINQFKDFMRYLLKLKVTGGLKNISLNGDKFVVFINVDCIVVLYKTDYIQFRVIKDRYNNSYFRIDTTKNDLIVEKYKKELFNGRYLLSTPYSCDLSLDILNSYKLAKVVTIEYKGKEYECISSDDIRLGELNRLLNIRFILYINDRVGVPANIDLSFNNDRALSKLYLCNFDGFDGYNGLRFKDSYFNLT